jgi:methylenetetrahydrofolate dehydrogenase (NADP+) / methenyltetrahydrofolate cyclohydrolase
MEIDGNLIKEHIKNECKKYQNQLQGKEITIVRFETPSDLEDEVLRKKYEAAIVSENQKVKTFESFGIKVNQIALSPETVTAEKLQDIIEGINQDEKVVAAIVQFPVPPGFRESIKLLSPQKDIDVVRGEPNNLFQVPATSEGIARIVESYAERNSNVAVVGGGGFVGKGVISYLQDKNINCFVLEFNDDKSRTREADIVVTVTGVAGFATPYILSQHKLVVDGGFTPTTDEPLGDVDKSAYSIPQNITPYLFRGFKQPQCVS